MSSFRNKHDRLDLARLFIAASKQELDAYRKSKDEIQYRQACEKAWAAIAQAMMHAYGTSINHHRDYSKFANELKKANKIDLVDAVIIGDKLHSAGFYHGALSQEEVRNAINLIEEKINQISP